MYRLGITCLLLACFLQAVSQQPCDNVLSGRIVDGNHRPVVGAAVFLKPQGSGVATDSTGNFRFQSLCEGSYAVEVQFLGFDNYSKSFTIPTTSIEIVLRESVRQLSEVEIRGEVLQVEHSHNYSKLNEAQLAQTAGKSLGESLKEMAGVNSIQSGPGIFKPVIHGVHSQRVLILNHGIRQEGQQWGAEHAPEVDPFIASDIVVIKDASSIKYGTDAIGGVIVVNPPPLPESNIIGGSLQSVVQSNGRSGTISGTLEGGFGDHHGWGWRVQGTGKHAGDFKTPDYFLTNTGIRELNYSAATGYHHKKFGVEIFGSHFETTLGILKGTSISTVDDLAAAMEREPPQYTSAFSYDIAEPRQEVSHNLLKINGHLNMSKGVLRLQYGFQNNHRQEYDIRKGGRSNIPSINLQLNTHSVETEYETASSDKRTFCFGLTGMLQDNNNIFGTQRIPFIPNFKNLSAGSYVIAKFFGKRSIVDLGARYDFRYYDVQGFDATNTFYTSDFLFANISATAGLTTMLGKDESFSSNISTSWRPPHVAELYSVGTHQSAAAIEYGLLLNDSTSAVKTVDEADINPEQAIKWVNSYRKQWKGVGLELTGYVNYIFNYIYLRPAGLSQDLRGVYPSLRYRQTDALFLGADITGRWIVSKGLLLGTKVSLLRAADVGNNDYLVFIPSNRYEVNAHYDFGLKTKSKWYVEAKVRYVARQNRAPRTLSISELYDENEFSSTSKIFDFMEAPEGYMIVNTAGGLELTGAKVRYDFRLSIDNALNTTYREYSNRFRYYADEIGRNFILSGKVIF